MKNVYEKIHFRHLICIKMNTTRQINKKKWIEVLSKRIVTLVRLQRVILQSLLSLKPSIKLVQQNLFALFKIFQKKKFPENVEQFSDVQPAVYKFDDDFMSSKSRFNQSHVSIKFPGMEYCSTVRWM